MNIAEFAVLFCEWICKYYDQIWVSYETYNVFVMGFISKHLVTRQLKLNAKEVF